MRSEETMTGQIRSPKRFNAYTLSRFDAASPLENE